MSDLTAQEQAASAHRVSLQIVFEIEQGGYRAGKISALDEQLARALLSLHGRLEAITPDPLWLLAVEQQKAKFEELRAELTEARRLLDMARKAIEDAPHDEDCAYIESLLRYGPGGRKLPTNDCNCWKSRALAAITPTEKP